MPAVRTFLDGSTAKQGALATEHNASTKGIGLSISEPLPPGDQFVVRLPQPEGPAASILYTVLRCDRVGVAIRRSEGLRRHGEKPQR